MIMPGADSFHQPAFDTIASAARGVIERCRCCGVLHLRFGNVLLRARLDGLIQLHYVVHSRCEWLAAERPHLLLGPGARTFSEDIQIGEGGVGFTFSPAELYELDTLLREAIPRLLRDVIGEPCAPVSRQSSSNEN